MKTIGRDFGDVARKVYATASGTLPNGRPVVVNADGTVSVVADTSNAQSVTSKVEYSADNVNNQNSVYDPNSNRLVVVYSDGGNSDYGTAIVGTINASSITFGTAVVFESSYAYLFGTTFDSTSNKIVVSYTDVGDSNKGKAVVGTVDSSNNSISFGTPATFNSGATVYAAPAYDANANKTVICYQDTGNNNGYGTAVVATVSGSSISFGSETVFASVTTNLTGISYDPIAQKTLIVYLNTSNNYAYGIVATVSGTSISFGSTAAFDTTSGAPIAAYDFKPVYDSIAQKTAIFYTHSSDGYAVVATISGTSVSFGSKVQSDGTGSTQFIQSVAFDSTINKIVFAYRNGGNNVGYVNTGTISGTSISFGTKLEIAGGAYYYACTYSPDANRTSIVFRDTDNDGASVVFRAAATNLNLTAENYIGMSSGGVEYDEGAASLGSAVVFEAAETVFISSTFDSANNRVVICYVDGGNSNYATAIVGTVSGTSISFGTPVVFLAARIFYNGVAFDSNSNKIVIAYRVASNGYGTAIVGTVSGTTISFGTSAVFQSATSSHAGVTFDSNSNKVVIAYNNNNQYGTAVVATVSGTNISFGTPVVYKSAYAAGGNDGSLFPVFDSNSNKVVIAYSDASNGNDGYAVVGTVSGTAISFGTAVTWGVESFYVSATFDSNSNKVVVAYRDADDSNKGKAIVGTVSGTTISFGSAVVFNAGATTNLRTVFDSNTNKVVITYQDSGNSDKSTLVEGEVSGTSISFGSELVFDAASSAYFASAFDSNSNKVVISYHNASDYGTAIVYKSGFDNTVRGQVASGGAALVNTKGAINTNQNALTAGQSYFVQTDGTITTTAGTPSVFAGTAVSATKLIVKG